MEAARILEEEHQVILGMLDVLERVIARIDDGRPFPTADATELLEFFVEFADKCHHAKEEDTLFPAMEANGFPRDQGPTAVMRYEHRVGRELVGDLRARLVAASAGDAEAVAAWTRTGREFIDLLRQHIRKEDHCLFPMACNAIRDPEHQCDLAARFRAIEADAGGNRHRVFLATAATLAARYGLPIIGADKLATLRELFIKD